MGDKEANQNEEDLCACTLDMAKWMEVGDTEFDCRSCLLAPVTQWYHEELEAGGFENLAKEIDEIGEVGSPLEVAEKLDEIKSRVPDELKERLRGFDCAAQIYEEDESEQPEGD